MEKYKRKKFFIKENFQLRFIAIFTLLLFAQVLIAGIFLFKLTNAAIEETVFKSHMVMSTSAQIIQPIIIKINLIAILASILTAAIALAVIYRKRRKLFNKIIAGLNYLRIGRTSYRIDSYGGKNTRLLISEFNEAARAIDQRKNDLINTLDALISEEDINRIVKLHEKLHSSL